MRTRHVQDKHDDRSPRLVKHSGIRQQDSGVGWGTKSVGNLEWWFARIRASFVRSFFDFLFITKDSAMHGLQVYST